MLSDGVLLYKMSDPTHFLLYRCDEKNEKGCLYVVRDYDKSGVLTDCSKGYAEVDSDTMFMFSPFEYSGTPEVVKCPDGTEGCKTYCNHGKERIPCITLDTKGRFVSQSYNKQGGSVITYKDYIPVPADFADEGCDNDAVEAPKSSICSASFSLPSAALLLVAFVLLL